MPKIAMLALEDGAVYSGHSFGAEGEVDGEVCFNTSMTGYQEILTDPSYRGQIVTMTYPQIGNYGVNETDVENAAPHLAGFIVKENSRIASNFRSTGSLDAYLKKHNVVGLAGIDTRALVRHIRSRGALKGVISTLEQNPEKLVAKAKASPGLVGRDLVREVLPSQSSLWTEGMGEWADLPGFSAETLTASKRRYRVVALDFGMKWNIPRLLHEVGCDVTVLPGNASSAEVLSHLPEGVFLSNGPGDPEPLDYAISTIRELIPQTTVFGICLGHQLLGLASGAKTFKLKFGHRGANQPVLNIQTGRVEITAQNHGFAVDEGSLPKELEITHRNLNDNTVAGIRHRKLPAFSVQYHPEASSGPHDSRYLFKQFRDLMASQQGALV